MRKRALPLGLLLLGVVVLAPVNRARADFTIFATPTQIQDIYTPEKSYATGTLANDFNGQKGVLPIVPLQTDWMKGTPVSPGSSTLINDPFKVAQFNAANYHNPDASSPLQTAQLYQVVVSLSYQFQNQVQMAFITQSTSTVTAQGVMHLDAISNTTNQTVSDLVNTPTFWTQKTLSYPTETGNPNYLQPLDQALTVKSISAIGYTDSSKLSLFTGNGTLMMPVIATAQSSYTNSSGNGAGGSITTAYAALSVTYYYYFVPEPSSLALTGLGALGLCVVSRAQSRRKERAAA